MSFFGKEYTLDSEENFAEFLQGVGVPDATAAKFLSFKPKAKIEKDGDDYLYTSVTASGTKTTKFTSGVEFEEKVLEMIPVKTTYTLDGSKLTQVITSDKGYATIIREFSDDTMVATITASVWDGSAKRTYKA